MSTETRRAGPGTRITLHFTVSLADGAVMDTTRNGEAATFTWGDGSLLQGFEQALSGLAPGDRRSVFIQADQGFGPHNPDNIQHFPRKDFARHQSLEPGLVMEFTDASGAGVPGVIQSADEQWVTVDFNHPLAGRDLNFEVEIIDVRPADEQGVRVV